MLHDSSFMLTFDIITIFPEMVAAYFNEGVVARANKAGLIQVNAHNLRNWTHDIHQTVDGRPFSGGPGMVMKFEPIYEAVNELTTHNKQLTTKIILTSARGKKFTQKKAQEYAKLDQLIIICGRYEGVDERVAKYIADESFSIGNFVLSGGELAALAVIDATARLVPGVLGNNESPQNLLFPQYTRPEIFTTKEGKTLKVPSVLLTGDHQKIEKWKQRYSK